MDLQCVCPPSLPPLFLPWDQKCKNYIPADASAVSVDFTKVLSLTYKPPDIRRVILDTSAVSVSCENTVRDHGYCTRDAKTAFWLCGSKCWINNKE